MVNKKTKKKTKWRSLSLGPGHDEEQTNDDPTKKRVPFKMEWKINQNNSNDNNSNNGYSNSFYRNNASNSHRFDKRASSKSYSKYHNTSSSHAGSNHHANRYEKLDKDLPKKVQFNEDEYTRITTPRQDVLFKKGYLSRPKTQPTTPTHQPHAHHVINGDEIYASGYITDSPPLTLTDCSTNGADYPYYPSHGAYINDALLNNNVYSNPVFLMPYADYFYPPQGIELDTYNSYQYSPPLIETPENVSQPTVSTTSTNCSESSESSEEATTTTAASPIKETPTAPLNDSAISTEKSVEESSEMVEVNGKTDISEASPQSGYENGYEVNPYLSPIVYYCVPPISLYPMPALSPFSVNKAQEFYSPEQEIFDETFSSEHKNGRYPIKKRKKRYRKAMSSSTSVTDYSEDDFNQQDASVDSGINEQTSLITSRPVAPSTPESILEIVHQSTLNVEVEEFRPKTQPHMESKLKENNLCNGINNHQNDLKQTNGIDKTPKKSKSGHNNINDFRKTTNLSVNNTVTVQPNISVVDNINMNGVNVKKRLTNPALDKKFLIESTKQIEMQNIDLKQSKLNENTKNEKNSSWVVVGGKNRTLKVESPVKDEMDNQFNDSVTKNPIREQESSSSQETVINLSITENNTNGSTQKKVNRKSKPKNKNLKKNGLQNKATKLQGFVIQEPVFNFIPIKPAVTDELTENQCLNEEKEDFFEDVFNKETELNMKNLTKNDDAELVQESICNISETNNLIDCNRAEVDYENLEEVACIEEIPWTEAEVNDVQDIIIEDINDKQLSNQSQTETTIPNCFDDKLVKSLIETVMYDEKADDNPDESGKENGCSNICEIIEYEIIAKHNDNQIIIHDKVDQLATENKVTKCLLNGYIRHDLDSEISESGEEVCTQVTLKLNESEIKPHDHDESNGIISEYRPYITAAVCNWLHTFNNNDLQSLFAIPLKPDIETNIRRCNEISHYFKDDELQNLDKFIYDHFYQYQQLSASSSLSSLIDDSDQDLEVECNQSKIGKTKKSAHKLFGCEIM